MFAHTRQSPELVTGLSPRAGLESATRGARLGTARGSQPRVAGRSAGCAAQCRRPSPANAWATGAGRRRDRSPPAGRSRRSLTRGKRVGSRRRSVRPYGCPAACGRSSVPSRSPRTGFMSFRPAPASCSARLHSSCCWDASTTTSVWATCSRFCMSALADRFDAAHFPQPGSAATAPRPPGAGVCRRSSAIPIAAQRPRHRSSTLHRDRSRPPGSVLRGRWNRPNRNCGGSHPCRGNGADFGWGLCACSRRFRLGLFQAWSNLELDVHCLVFPRPEPGHIPLPAPSAGDTTGLESGRGQDDFSGLRPVPAWRLAASRRLEGGRARPSR